METDMYKNTERGGEAERVNSYASKFLSNPIVLFSLSPNLNINLGWISLALFFSLCMCVSVSKYLFLIFPFDCFAYITFICCCIVQCLSEKNFHFTVWCCRDMSHSTSDSMKAKKKNRKKKYWKQQFSTHHLLHIKLFYFLSFLFSAEQARMFSISTSLIWHFFKSDLCSLTGHKCGGSEHFLFFLLPYNIEFLE